MAAGERQVENDKGKPIFCELSANELEPEITEIESLCVECGKNVSNRSAPFGESELEYARARAFSRRF